MNRLNQSLTAPILTVFLLALTLSAIAIDYWLTARARDVQAQSDKAQKASDEASALVQAIEQYCVDFPNAGPIANNREWTQRLAGQNEKGVKYLKVDRFARDSSDRLLDPCGAPFSIEVQGTPGFVSAEKSNTEFHVRSLGCRWGIAIGDRLTPQNPRSIVSSSD